MSVRSAHPVDISEQIAANPGLMDSDAMELGEGATGFQGSNRNNPLNRKVVVAVRATLADLSTNAGRAVWAPSAEALKGIYQQKQFTDLGGEAAAQGDLKSVVLHAVEARSVQSSFPIALGARITGVEEKYYSSVGAPFSMIVLPNQKGMAAVKLQEEDVSVAYDFAKVHASPEPGATTQTYTPHRPYSPPLVRVCRSATRATRQKISRCAPPPRPTVPARLTHTLLRRADQRHPRRPGAPLRPRRSDAPARNRDPRERVGPPDGGHHPDARAASENQLDALRHPHAARQGAGPLADQGL